METDPIQTVEINGVRYELDLRGAKRVQQFKVGDRVKVLVKNYSGYTVHAGAIVGIDAFQALPTVVVAYIPTDAWDNPEVKFVSLNAQSKDVEIAPMAGDEITPTTTTILGMFDKARAKLEGDIRTLELKRSYFLERFGSSIGSARAEAAAEHQ